MATPSPRRRRALLPVLLGLCLHAAPAASKAILGIDLGATFMKVALVKRNSPLEIVTNMHSKRRTEQMVLFDQGTRFYGADANSMAARKPSKIPSLMSVMLGRDDAHPTVKVSLVWFGRSVGQSIGEGCRNWLNWELGGGGGGAGGGGAQNRTRKGGWRIFPYTGVRFPGKVTEIRILDRVIYLVILQFSPLDRVIY